MPVEPRLTTWGRVMRTIIRAVAGLLWRRGRCRVDYRRSERKPAPRFVTLHLHHRLLGQTSASPRGAEDERCGSQLSPVVGRVRYATRASIMWYDLGRSAWIDGISATSEVCGGGSLTVMERLRCRLQRLRNPQPVFACRRANCQRDRTLREGGGKRLPVAPFVVESNTGVRIVNSVVWVPRRAGSRTSSPPRGKNGRQR